MDSIEINDILKIFISVFGGIIIYQITFFFVKRKARLNKRFFPSLLSKYIYYPGLFLMVTISLWISLLFLQSHFVGRNFTIIAHILKLCVISTVSFLLLRTITVLRELTLNHYSKEKSIDYSLRKAKTKFYLIQRIVNFLIIFATVAIMLMTFDSIRHIGSTLLASAGVMGLIIGFAAQKSLGTLFAGIQIAISQPIRIDDIVVVEEQFGIIAEITLTYVVINTWDGRRLIVPISYFLENTFENWTRMSPEVVGKVKIYTDYSLPVDSLRKEFLIWIKDSPLWDKRKCGLLVTAANEKTIEIRATMSAKNSDDSFDLECYIREKLIAHIQQHYPEALPRVRMDLKSAVNDYSFSRNNVPS